MAAWKRAQILKYALEDLKDAGFSRIDGPKLVRDQELPAEIEIYKHPQSDSEAAYFGGRVVLGAPGNVSDAEYAGYWNVAHLETICTRPDLYPFDDVDQWSDTLMAKDLRGPLKEFFKKHNTYESAFDFLLSEGDTIEGCKVTIGQSGTLNQRDAILAAYIMAKAKGDDQRINLALDMLRQYANSNTEAREDVEFYLSLHPEFPNVLSDSI